MSSAPEPTGGQRRGLGRGLEVLLGGAAQIELAAAPGRRDPSQPAPAPPPLRPRSHVRPRRVDPLAGSGPAGARPAAGRGRLGADRRRAPLARRAGGRRRHGARGRAAGRRPGVAAPRPGRERRPRAALAGRGGACLRRARRRVRAVARGRRGARRTVEAVGLEPAPHARAPGRRAGRWSSAASCRRVTPARCSRFQTRRVAGAWRGRSSAAGCPSARPSGPHAGPARSRSRAREPLRSTPPWPPAPARR